LRLIIKRREDYPGQENALTNSDGLAPGMLEARLGAERYRSCRELLLQEREVPNL